MECELKTYHYGGTLAVQMFRTTPLQDAGMGLKSGGEDRELFANLTVNLERSSELPLDVQFIDENNLPGIGDWLQENSMAEPYGVYATSGFFTYPSYRFKLSEEEKNLVRDIRFESDPKFRSRQVELFRQTTDCQVKSAKDLLSLCVTFGELLMVWQSLPCLMQREVPLPEKVALDGGEALTAGQWDARRFDVDVPTYLPAYGLKQARDKFNQWIERYISTDSPNFIQKSHYGDVKVIGATDLVYWDPETKEHYSKPFLKHHIDENGSLALECFAIRTTSAESVPEGPFFEYSHSGTSMYRSHKGYDYEMTPTCWFSPMGSLIAFQGANLDYGYTPMSRPYQQAVDKARETMTQKLDKILESNQKDTLRKKFRESQQSNNNQQKNKGIKR